MRFRLVYSNGFEIIQAKDIFDAAAQSKRLYKAWFKMPIAIQECLAFPDNPKPEPFAPQLLKIEN